MRLGIFEAVFERPTLREMFDAVRSAGFSSVQFDFVSAGIGSQPSSVPQQVAQRVRDDAEHADIRIASVSGTFNMIHPDHMVRQSGLTSLEAIASTCSTLGSDIVTLCTGTRDTRSMWRDHPDNGSTDAWTDLLQTMTAALVIADRCDVRLVVEPEPANVVRNADRALGLLEELDHPRLKIVLDPANILAGDSHRSPRAALDHAFDLLGDHIILAHAKDLDDQGTFCAAGTGIVPWEHFRRRLEEISFAGDVIFHTLTEVQASAAKSVLTR